MTKTSMDLSELQAGHDQRGVLRSISEAVHAIEWRPSSRSLMAGVFARIDTEDIDPVPGITRKAA